LYNIKQLLAVVLISGMSLQAYIRLIILTKEICAYSSYRLIVKEFYERLVQKGKPKKVAIIACARKLALIALLFIKQRPHLTQHKEMTKM